MLVPQGLAYAILAGVPPVYGLYTGWLPLIVYSIMGSCKQLAVGPEALLAVLLGSLLDKYDPEEAAKVAHLMAFVVGTISFIFGAVRFGFMHNVISRWVLAGFINAVALIIALSQLDTLLGFKFERGLDPYEKFLYACEHIHRTNKYTVTMGVVGIVFLFAVRTIKKRLAKKGFKNVKYFPEVMALVIAGIVFMYFTKWGDESAWGGSVGKGVKILGKIEGGFPSPKAPHFSLSEIQEMAGDCLLIVIVGFVEATAVSRTLATKHGYQISSNRELIAFGVANMLGSFFQTYPSFASIPRTSIQDSAGSRTCLCGFLVSTLCLIVVLFLTPLFYYLPNVAMGSIIFVAAFGLVELEELFFLWKTRSWKDFAMFWIAAIATFILGVELGVLIAVGMCIFIVLKQASTPQVYSVLGRSDDGQFKDVSKFPDAAPIEGVILVRIDEVLTFANMGEFKLLLENLQVIKDSSASIAAVVLNFKNVGSVDASTLLTFHEMIESYHAKHIQVGFVEMNEKVFARFKIAGVVKQVGSEYFFDSNLAAIDFIEAHIIKKPSRRPTCENSHSSIPPSGSELSHTTHDSPLPDQNDYTTHPDHANYNYHKDLNANTASTSINGTEDDHEHDHTSLPIPENTYTGANYLES
eukprot:Phypoly_transcript_02632.p1 GENE.Phypoly_transcript_02632~~Phypoly_transcript_02632.p1  ORF type:complete len:638 (+),score=82.57 Phypoly_transcript_02632:774-2687(+)